MTTAVATQSTRGRVQRRTVALLEAMENIAVRYGHPPDWSPALYLAEVAADPANLPETRLDAAKAAAPYFNPRMQQIDLKSLSMIANLDDADDAVKAAAKAKLFNLIDGVRTPALATAPTATTLEHDTLIPEETTQANGPLRTTNPEMQQRLAGLAGEGAGPPDTGETDEGWLDL